MLRIGLSIGTSILAILASAAAQASGVPTAAQWCTINPALPTLGKSYQLPKSNIQIVLASKQAYAQSELTNSSFAKMLKRQVLDLVGNANDIPMTAKYYYLVRASAFYVDEDYRIKSNLEASVFPEEEALEVVNTSLSQPGTKPANLAIVVATDTEIERVEIICLTAA